MLPLKKKVVATSRKIRTNRTFVVTHLEAMDVFLVGGDNESFPCCLCIWNAKTLTKIKKLHAHLYAFDKILHIKDMNLILTGGNDHYIRVWNLQFKCLQSFEHSKLVKDFEVIEDKLLSCGNFENIRVWNLKTMKFATLINTDNKSGFNRLKYVPKHNRILTSNTESNEIWVFAWPSKELLQKIALPTEHNGIEQLRYYDQRDEIVIGGGIDSNLLIWNFVDSSKLKEVGSFLGLKKIIKSKVSSMLLLQDRDLLLLTTADSVQFIFSYKTQELLAVSPLKPFCQHELVYIDKRNLLVCFSIFRGFVSFQRFKSN